MVKIELFATPGCKKCASAQRELRDTAVSALGAGNVSWRELNVLDELDYAIALGVLTMPAIAVNGKLIFSSLPAYTFSTPIFCFCRGSRRDDCGTRALPF